MGHPVDRNRFRNNVENRKRCSNRKKYDAAIESVRMHKIAVHEGGGGEWGERAGVFEVCVYVCEGERWKEGKREGEREIYVYIYIHV